MTTTNQILPYAYPYHDHHTDHGLTSAYQALLDARHDALCLVHWPSPWAAHRTPLFSLPSLKRAQSARISVAPDVPVVGLAGEEMASPATFDALVGACAAIRDEAGGVSDVAYIRQALEREPGWKGLPLRSLKQARLLDPTAP